MHRYFNVHSLHNMYIDILMSVLLSVHAPCTQFLYLDILKYVHDLYIHISRISKSAHYLFIPYLKVYNFYTNISKSVNNLWLNISLIVLSIIYTYTPFLIICKSFNVTIFLDNSTFVHREKSVILKPKDKRIILFFRIFTMYLKCIWNCAKFRYN